MHDYHRVTLTYPELQAILEMWLEETTFPVTKPHGKQDIHLRIDEDEVHLEWPHTPRPHKKCDHE